MNILRRLSPKKIFVIDSLSAALSAICLGIILPQFDEAIGMPHKSLLFLALVASVFAVFSLSCWAFATTQQQLLLKIVAVNNLNYCFLTIGLLLRFREDLQPLGGAYFLGEILLIAILIAIELRASSTPPERPRI